MVNGRQKACSLQKRDKRAAASAAKKAALNSSQPDSSEGMQGSSSNAKKRRTTHHFLAEQPENLTWPQPKPKPAYRLKLVVPKEPPVQPVDTEPHHAPSPESVHSDITPPPSVSQEELVSARHVATALFQRLNDHRSPQKKDAIHLELDEEMSKIQVKSFSASRLQKNTSEPKKAAAPTLLQTAIMSPALHLIPPRKCRPPSWKRDRLLPSPNDSALFVWTTFLHGYCSDVTRTLPLPAESTNPDIHLRMWNFVHSAQRIAFQIVRVGVVAKRVDEALRLFLGLAGYATYLTLSWAWHLFGGP
ncbi:hypothetical protein IW262DRAFT_1455186 [Armillaria fumosa]|nr:hypothetical protein IW262DRAFT_1455186 [Armillaria fumosa]